MTDEEKRAERENWKQMSLRQKAVHFRTYYLLPTIAVAAVTAAVVMLLLQILLPHEQEILTVAVFGDYLDEEQKEAMEAELKELLGCGKYEGVMIQDGYRTDDYNDAMKLQAMVGVKAIDAVVASPEDLTALAGQGYLAEISELLTEEELRACEADQLLVEANGFKDIDEAASTASGVGLGEPAFYGLELTASERWMSIARYTEKPVLGMMVNTTHPENVRKFLDFLL